MITREQKEGQAGRGRSTADPGDRHLWRATLIFGLVTMVVGMAYTLVIGPLFEHSTGRWIVPDAWVPLRGASYVGNGALGYLYESTNIFVATPLLPIVLAVGVFILVVVPAAIVWGHYEDVLAICFVLLALGALLRDRSLSAALLFGVAVAFKQWALLGIPLLVAVSPVGERPTVAVRALVVPALLVAFPLAVDWAHASRALIWTRSYPQMGHRAVWVSSSVRVMVGNPSRLGAFLVVFAVTWWLRGRAEPRLLLAGFGIVFPGEAPLRAGAVLP